MWLSAQTLAQFQTKICKFQEPFYSAGHYSNIICICCGGCGSNCFWFSTFPTSLIFFFFAFSQITAVNAVRTQKHLTTTYPFLDRVSRIQIHFQTFELKYLKSIPLFRPLLAQKPTSYDGFDRSVYSPLQSNSLLTLPPPNEQREVKVLSCTL